MTTHSMNTVRPNANSPYSNTTPLLAVGFLALLIGLILKLIGA